MIIGPQASDQCEATVPRIPNTTMAPRPAGLNRDMQRQEVSSSSLPTEYICWPNYKVKMCTHRSRAAGYPTHNGSRTGTAIHDRNSQFMIFVDSVKSQVFISPRSRLSLQVQHSHRIACRAADRRSSRQRQAYARSAADRVCTTRLSASSSAQPSTTLSSADVHTPVTDAACQDEVTALTFQHRKQIRDRLSRLMLKNLTFRELEDWCKSEGIAFLLICSDTGSQTKSN